MNVLGMGKVSEEVLAICDLEPILIPGAIQPHGALLVVNHETLRIEQVSTNIGAFLGMAHDEVLRIPFLDLFKQPSDALAAIDLIRKVKPYSKIDRSIVELAGPFEGLICECHWLTDDTFVIEVERANAPMEADAFRTGHLRSVRRIALVSEAGEGLPVLLPVVARCVRELTGYDRVMIYQMDDSGHGSVVAEDKAVGVDGFLGLHFPSTDIPSQARKLYLLNRVRVLSDIQYSKVGIEYLPSTTHGQPLDMSRCHLRSISPVHVEYLQNMGVAATLVISLVIDGKLWGMIACHHHSPRSLDARLRNQCEMLGHVVSLAIQTEQQREIRRAFEASQTLSAELEAKIGQDANWFRELITHGDFLLDSMNAVGAVLLEENEQQSIGMVPYSGIVEKIRRALKHYSGEDLIAIESLAALDPALESLSAEFCGCLMTTISTKPETQVIWFRKEHRYTIQWAGNPEKQLTSIQGEVRLSPRKSFEKWCQEVKGRSQPWSLQDRYRARAIAQFISVRKADDSSRQKFHFLANLSHEIRTPMSAIMGYVDLLANEDLGGTHTPLQREALATIKRNGDNLLKLLSDLLDLTRLDAGTMVLNQAECSPRSVVRHVYAESHAAAQRKGLVLSISSASPVPCLIRSDASRLKQVLMNLVDNAIKFTAFGSVQLEVIYNAARPQNIEFAVRDTGCGLSPSDIRTLFRPFNQIDGSLTREHGGTGLGLRIAKQISQMLGGDVWLRSATLGLGAEFIVRVPTGLTRVENLEDLKDDDIAGSNPTTNPLNASISLNDLRILVAEDGLDNQRLVAMFLRKAGANVTIVENGGLAIEEISRRFRTSDAIHVVLMDMQMPVMDGYTATRQLRSLGYTLPVIAMTAHAVTGDRRKCLESGCDEYLAKPVDRDRLVATIHRLTVEQRVLRATALLGTESAPPGLGVAQD